MLELYSWPTPNGWKVHIMLEELGLPYRTEAVDIGAGEQFAEPFLKISPNNKIPALVDPDGPEQPDGRPFSLFESGAILLYLAEKEGRFLPKAPEGRHRTLEWLFFQMGGIGPMLGQVHHFVKYAPEPLPYAIERYSGEAKRLYGVVDKRLAAAGGWLNGEGYSIADMACFAWMRLWEGQQIKLAEFPQIERWLETIAARPAVERGLELLADKRRKGPLSERERQSLFGSAGGANKA